MLESIIAYLYLISGTIALAGYWPQISRLLKADQAPTEISVKTWTIWFAEGFIALLYGIICLEDFIFCFIAGLDLLFITAVIFLVIRNRYVLFGPSSTFFNAFITYYFQRPFFRIDPIEEPAMPIRRPINKRGVT